MACLPHGPCWPSSSCCGPPRCSTGATASRVWECASCVQDRRGPEPHPRPRSYQPDAGNFDERFVFIGPSVMPRNDQGDFPLEQLDGKPVLLISLGTTPLNQRPDFYKACFEAFRDTRWQVVMACGMGLDPATLGPAPSNILVRQRVPQLEVLAARPRLPHPRRHELHHGGALARCAAGRLPTVRRSAAQWLARERARAGRSPPRPTRPSIRRCCERRSSASTRSRATAPASQSSRGSSGSRRPPPRGRCAPAVRHHPRGPAPEGGLTRAPRPIPRPP